MSRIPHDGPSMSELLGPASIEEFNASLEAKVDWTDELLAKAKALLDEDPRTVMMNNARDGVYFERSRGSKPLTFERLEELSKLMGTKAIELGIEGGVAWSDVTPAEDPTLSIWVKRS